MNKFDKLYNLILQSIISQNAEYRKKLIQNSTWSMGQKSWILRYLNKFNDNKLADFLVKYYANHQLTNFTDERIQKVKTILKLNQSIDTQNFKGTLAQFIEKYQPTIQKTLQKQISKTIAHLDSIPEFSQKQQLEKGVVIYRVQQSQKGQAAVRKIVDDQWGKDANPWCLIARNEDAQSYWRNYSNYPKHIAFQNGKLLAFSASNDAYIEWWDREDHSHPGIPLSDGTQITSPHFEWTLQERREQFIKKYQPHLRLNKETGRYDCDTHIEIKDNDLVKGHFPVPFGVIEGNFKSHRSEQLIDLTDSPTRVQGNFDIRGSYLLKSLKGAPRYIGGEFDCSDCYRLESLIDGPEEVGDLDCHNCKSLNNLEGLPKKNHNGNFYFWDCSSLTSLVGLPNEVRNLDVSGCNSLKTLKGCPEIVHRGFNCSRCFNLISLEHGPRIVGGDYQCNDCSSLISLIGAAEKVGGQFNCQRCVNLSYLKGAPKEVGTHFWCKHCHSLINLEGIRNSKIEGNVYCLGCSQLHVTDQDWEKLNLQPPKKDWYE